VVAETFRAQIMRLAAPEGGTPPQAKSTEPVAPARAEGVEQLTQMLERSDRELDAFIYSVSHDVRTPLKTAQTFCGLLKEESGGQLSERAQEYLQYLEAGLQRADRMVGGLLQLSRTARAPLQREPVDMALLARSILPELDQTRVGATEIRLPESLPVEADARLLGTMLKHLLENALKFTSRRDAPVIELAEADGVYRLSDNGAGFDAERVDRLFLPFQRLHPPDDFPGTGVGLATVQRIVHRHGGRVWIEGAVDQGATVFWTLPV
jgi:light-regulated signal transduction histidine kinase (bacteriophytochrome)